MAEYKTPQKVANADISYKQDPNRMKSQQVTPATPAMRVSAGDPARNNPTKEGITIRGCGAATKGTKARGPMA